MLLVALVAGTLRLLNPPKSSATTTIDLSEVEQPSSPVHRNRDFESHLSFMQSPFVIANALRNLESDGRIRGGPHGHGFEVRGLHGWSHFGGYTTDRIQWIQSHLTIKLTDSDNEMRAALTLTSAEGTEDDLHVIVQAIRRAYLDEVSHAKKLKRRRESEGSSASSPT
jgi:hypothetical protein